MGAQAQPNSEGLTFEKVWLLFQETDRKFHETDREFKEIAQRFKETDQKFQETTRKMQETDRKMQETDRQISRLGSRLGQLIEHLAASNILEKFQDLGFQFTRISRNHKIKDGQGRVLAEFDLLLENGDYAMVIEVKSLFTVEDVKDHLRRMKTLRSHADAHGDGRKYLGAAAGALIEEKARDCALENGLYVVEQAGDTVRIKAPQQRAVW